MPIYDFQCQKCKKTFELSLKLSEREGSSEKKLCPHCTSKDIKQLMTFKGGVMVKGSSVGAGCGCESADNCGMMGGPMGPGIGGCPGGMCGGGMGGCGFND
ncbi:MAG: zinc ribbon domain-containing protein [Oligoflexia bacterium]|nr:zinc ribbon domain-containing protein [Oligoflexia bacterium]